MKITRRQLRKLILREFRIKPGGDLGLDDKEYGQIQTLARHDEPEFRTQADDLAGVFGHEGSFSQDMSDHDTAAEEVIARGIVDDPERFLTQEQINATVDEWFIYYPDSFEDAMSQGGMSLRDIAEELWGHLQDLGVISDGIYDIDGNTIPGVDKIVIDRIETSLQRPEIMHTGLIF